MRIRASESSTVRSRRTSEIISSNLLILQVRTERPREGRQHVQDTQLVSGPLTPKSRKPYAVPMSPEWETFLSTVVWEVI